MRHEMIVLDPTDPVVSRFLYVYGDQAFRNEAPEQLAAMMQAQITPPRIKQPGPWGVVVTPDGREWGRVPRKHQYLAWLDDLGHRASWFEIPNPVLVRPGLGDDDEVR